MQYQGLYIWNRKAEYILEIKFLKRTSILIKDTQYQTKLCSPSILFTFHLLSSFSPNYAFLV